MKLKKKIRPHLWQTGPDPWLRQLRYKFLRARVQARYWNQSWEIDWEDYVKLMRKKYNHGRDLESLNFCRRDTTGPWTLDNVFFMTRKEMVDRNRKQLSDGTYTRRIRKKDLPITTKNTKHTKTTK